MKILPNLFDPNERKIKKLRLEIKGINLEWEKIRNWNNKDFAKKTRFFKNEILKIDSLEKKESYLNKILPIAFAMVKEATLRTQEILLHDEQLIAGIVLHRMGIAEQKTGEGKTNTAVLSLYLNSLTGLGCHLVTPNDYLSKHGAGWMGEIYNFLGVSTSVIVHDNSYVFDSRYNSEKFLDKYSKNLKNTTRKEAYQADITYGTNNEFGFDYLRDNMARSLDQVVQSNPNKDEGFHNFTIVDEVDSLLIDEARTPLIISAPAEDLARSYSDFSRIATQLVKGTDYEIDEKFRSASLTDLGVKKVERFLGLDNLYEKDFESIHHIENAVRAKEIYVKDKDYVVKEGEVVIVDEFTGRLMLGRRWSEGLHQAIEAKEGVAVQKESRTLATISFQNYFRMYRKLAGMTGTAQTEAEEFFKIYGVEVVVVPTHKSVIRQDRSDAVYKTVAAKYRAITNEIEDANKKGQPVLIGTTSIGKNELLSKILTRKGIKHNILNAKQHEKEAQIIAQAGKKNAVTIATNMAGRGVDIKLGGDPGTVEEKEDVISVGGLYVIGSERHESRRIDNQLRGRSGRQGEPGKSKFFVSLQDDLMRIFGGAQIESLMTRFKMDENTPLEAGIVSKAIENAQKKVEGFNFDSRKRVVEYDDVMNVQRKAVYAVRKRALMLEEIIKSGHVSRFTSDLSEFKNWYIDKITPYYKIFPKDWERYFKDLGYMWLEVVKQETLRVIDFLWMEHLDAMDDLREGIGLRGYAQIDPIIAYKKEGREYFEKLISNIWGTLGDRFSKLKIEQKPTNIFQESGKNYRMTYKHDSPELGVTDEAKSFEPVKSTIPKTAEGNKVGRNDPCPCGSGKKYKKCHGKF